MLWPEQYEKLRAALPTDATNEPTDVYELYDRDGTLLYVGISLNLAQRMEQHRGAKRWWQNVKRIEVRHCSSRAHALFWEYVTIQTRRPRYNIQGQAKEPLAYPDAALICAISASLQTVSGWDDMPWPTDPDEMARMDEMMAFLEESVTALEASWQAAVATTDPRL